MSIFFDFIRNSLFRSKKDSFLSRISKNIFFWVFLLKKKHIRKRSIFSQKPWTNPFAKCHFSGLKSILFYPEYQKMFLSGLFLLKKDIEIKVYFVTKKPWSNPFQKYRFFDLLQNFPFEVEKAFFSILNIKKMCLFSLFLQNMTERSIFWQKPWTNRLSQMTFFFRFVKLDCVSLKGIHFYTDYKKRSVFT